MRYNSTLATPLENIASGNASANRPGRQVAQAVRTSEYGAKATQCSKEH